MPKKVLAIILVLSLAFSCLGVVGTVLADTSVSAAKSVWDGTTDQEFEGAGTAESPYLITSAAELAGLVTLGKDATTDKYYKLTTDVDLSFKDWYEGSFTSGTNMFNGTFDGAGHRVYGMKKTSGAGWGSCTGLFPVIGNKTHIKNVGIEDAHITATNGDYRAGFIFGGGTLTNGWTDWNGAEMVSVDYCYVDSTSTISGGKSGGIGGVVVSGNGWQGYIRVSNCYTLAASPSSGAIGDVNLPEARYMQIYSTSGFKGHNAAYKVVNAYSSATLTQTDIDKGVKQLTDAQMIGEAAKTNMTGFDFESVWQTNEGEYPTLRVFNVIPDDPGDPDEPNNDWDGTVATEFAGGDGSENTPYLIENASQLAKAVKSGSESSGKYYKLTKDIVINSDLNNNPRNWYGAADSELYNLAFRGTFDGDGHTISGLYYNGSNYAGLFPLAYETARFKNLCIKNSSITTTGNAGVIVGHLYAQKSITKDKEGYSDNYPSFVQCCIGEDVSVNATLAGGVVGVANGEGTVYISFYNCFIGANLTGKTNVGADIAHGWRGGGWKDFKSYPVNVITTAPFNKNFIADGDLYKGTNVYTTAEHETLPAWLTKLDEDKAKGAAAKTNMPGLDFDSVWQTNSGAYPTLRIFNENSGEEIVNWDGTVATEFAGGDGSQKTPYLIENAAQLAKAVTSGSGSNGKYYKLTKDIVINSDLENNPRNWYGAADSDSDKMTFRGVFDGDGHTISGLYYDGTDEYTGLFPLASETSRFRNLCIKNFSITTTKRAGAIVGHLYAEKSITWSVNGYAPEYPSFVQCYVAEDVYVKANLIAGGIVGVANGTPTVYVSFYNCFIGAKLTSDKYTGADIGYGWKNALYSFPEYVITTTPFSKALITDGCYKGNKVYTTAEHETLPYGVTKLTEDQAKGEAAKTNMPGLDFVNIWQTNEGAYPTFRVSTDDPGDEGVNWNGKVAMDFAGGNGSQKTPYLIETAAQLAKAVKAGKASVGKYYKLANDIVINGDLENNPTSWYGCSGSNDDYNTWVFSGTFDGDGHTISGLYYKGNDAYTGLFPIISEKARIKNLGIKNSVIESGDCAGVIAGHLYSESSIKFDKNGYSPNYPSLVHCYIAEDVTVNAKYAGGYIGRANGSGALYVCLYNCFIGAKLNGSEGAGADIGHGWSGGFDYGVCLENVITTSPCNTKIEDLDYYGANVYTTAEDANMPGWFTKLTVDQAKGDNAQTNMSGLDFNKVWMVNQGEYPSLVEFSTTEVYKVSFDVSGIEGASAIAALNVKKGASFTVPTAPEGYHWAINGTAVVGDTSVAQDTVVKGAAHFGGEATCKDKAACSVCGVQYGELSKTHGSKVISGNYDATCTEAGYTGDEVCSICGQIFKKGSVIQKTPHTFVDDECTVCGISNPNGSVINADIDPSKYSKPSSGNTVVIPPKNEASSDKSENQELEVEPVAPTEESETTPGSASSETENDSNGNNALLIVLIAVISLLFVSAIVLFVIYFIKAKAIKAQKL